MEKRFYFGLGILLVFLILGIVTAAAMDAVCDPIARQLEEASQEALFGSLEEGILLATEAKADWTGSWQGIATVADHTPIDEIEGLFAEMEVYAQARDGEHFGACCAQLSKLVNAMAEAHAFAWWNLL